jgi:TetR/AcrR family transcriptional regulator, tetracycline repressor protein
MRRSTKAISRQSLVALALRIADGEGLAAASFRRLADELGVTPMALYHHVHDRSDLVQAMLDAILAEVDSPPSTGAWDGALRSLLRSYVAVRRRHPCIAAVLGEQPMRSREGFRLTEAALEILEAAGLTPAASARVVQQLALLMSSPSSDRGGASRGAPDLPSEEFPRTRASAEYFGRWDELDDDLVVELLVSGVQALVQRSVHGHTSSANKRNKRRNR